MRNPSVPTAALALCTALAGTGVVSTPSGIGSGGERALLDSLGTSVARADDTAPAATAAPRRRRAHGRRPAALIVSFPGFHLNADGTSRCFVHVDGAVTTPETNASPRRFEVRLRNARVAARNHMNPLETQYFNTPMVRARLVRRGRTDLVFVVELRADVTPTMHTEADPNGGTLVIVDLPAGNYVTTPPHVRDEWERDAEDPPRTGRGSASVRPSESSEPPPATSTTPRPSTSPAPSTTPPPSSTSPEPRRPDPERPPIFSD